MCMQAIQDPFTKLGCDSDAAACWLPPVDNSIHATCQGRLANDLLDSRVHGAGIGSVPHAAACQKA